MAQLMTYGRTKGESAYRQVHQCCKKIWRTHLGDEYNGYIRENGIVSINGRGPFIR